VCARSALEVPAPDRLHEDCAGQAPLELLDVRIVDHLLDVCSRQFRGGLKRQAGQVTGRVDLLLEARVALGVLRARSCSLLAATTATAEHPRGCGQGFEAEAEAALHFILCIAHCAGGGHSSRVRAARGEYGGEESAARSGRRVTETPIVLPIGRPKKARAIRFRFSRTHFYTGRGRSLGVSCCSSHAACRGEPAAQS
jgi:hypothetical protein